MNYLQMKKNTLHSVLRPATSTPARPGYEGCLEREQKEDAEEEKIEQGKKNKKRAVIININITKLGAPLVRCHSCLGLAYCWILKGKNREKKDRRS